MFDTRKLLMLSLVVALGLGTCTVAQAVDLGGEDYNTGIGNTAGLTYTQGSITIGEEGDNKAWAFGPINWIDTTDANSGSVFLSSLVRRETANVQWGGVSFFEAVDGDEIMYFGAATSEGAEPRAFFGTHDQESGLQTASAVRFEAGTTHLMVGELDIDGGEVRMWIDPAFGTVAPAPDLVAPFAMSPAGKAVGAVRLNAEVSPFITGDEVLVGTSWNDVVPIPEPSSLLLLALGALALACGRRK